MKNGIKKESIMQKAGMMLDAGWHCSEAVLKAVGEQYFDLKPEMIRLATPFAGGVGDTYGELCGAFTGGLMVIGGMYGRSENGISDYRCQVLAVQWREAFREEFEWLKCGDLRANWVGKPEQESCSVLVAEAAGLLIDQLSENLE